MPALNFQERFADLIENGKKRQTLWRVWKRPIKVDVTLYLYTGMRTKRCRKLGEVICKNITKIEIRSNCILIENLKCYLNYFARNDGFKNWFEMRDWFKKQYGLPFEGVLIQW